MKKSSSRIARRAYINDEATLKLLYYEWNERRPKFHVFASRAPTFHNIPKMESLLARYRVC